MTLAQFAIAVGADRKWVQNAARLLGRSPAYDQAGARHLGLVKLLRDEVGVTLERADLMATELIATGADSVAVGEHTSVRVDLRRYQSDFAVRLAQALEHGEPRRRGRRREGRSAIESAREYGIDIGLLESSLAATPGERLRRLEADAEFARRLRRSAR